MERLLILGENYGGSVLVLTDLTNEQLKTVLVEIVEGIENGVGETSEEIAERLFYDCLYKELGDTENSGFDWIRDLETTFLVDYLEFGYSVVKLAN